MPSSQGRLPVEDLGHEIELGVYRIAQHLFEKAVIQLPPNRVRAQLNEGLK